LNDRKAANVQSWFTQALTAHQTNLNAMNLLSLQDRQERVLSMRSSARGEGRTRVISSVKASSRTLLKVPIETQRS
jgi:hypothetical protein